jgi:hypothetical protein
MSFLARLRRLVKAPDAATESPAPIYLDLRDRVIHTAPGAVGIVPSAEAPNVWGVLFEVALDKGSATIVALADGTTSLYTSGGGGTIGGGEHEHIATMSRKLVQLADAHFEAFPPAETLPLPTEGRSALVLLTYAGPRRVEDGSRTLAQGRGALSRVYMAAQDVLTHLRLEEESRRA